MLTYEHLRRFGGLHLNVNVSALSAGLSRALMGSLLLAGAMAIHHLGGSRVLRPKIAAATDLSSTPYDFAPSAMRQRVLDRREAGLPVPAPSELLVEEQRRQAALELQQEKELVRKYFGEILSRDSDIAKLRQAVQENQVNLAKLAAQLGLPEDRLAPPSPPPDKAVGGPTAQDILALVAGPAPKAGPLPVVSSAKDLQDLVSRYLNIWCPLPASDARCGQAINHARRQLARGHGLDVNKPDALPTLNLDVTQPFGPTNEVLEPLENVNGRLVHFHDGVDLAASYDEPVMAAAAGTVVFADITPSGALTVEIAHAGGWHTVYMHEEQLLVSPGQPVEKGQIIGLVGSSGNSTGPHLHFMIKDPSGQPVDPLPWIR